jgi:hypothetical protein
MPAPANARKFVAKNESVLLRAIADTKQTTVGDAIGHDSSYVSNFLNGKQKFTLQEVLAMLEACNLAIHRLSEDDMIVSREDWKMYLTLAKRHMEDVEV